MLRQIGSVVCMAIVGVALLATALMGAKKPPTTPPPPPNLGGSLYFLRGGQVWQMNGNGSAKAPALPRTYFGRPSSRLYNGLRWWLYARDMDGDGATFDHELFAFRCQPDGSSYQEVQLTNVVPDGFSLQANQEDIQWSNDGVDSFCSVTIYDTHHPTDRPKLLYRFPTSPIDFDPDAPPLLSIADGELVLDDRNEDDFYLLAWNLGEYSWSADGEQIAYVSAIPNPSPQPPLYSPLGGYTLRIKTLGTPANPDPVYQDVLLSDTTIDKLGNISWSPNGDRICCYAWLDLGDGSVRSGDWTFRVDGSSLTQLYTGYSGSNGGKKWSLDAAWITYEDTNNTGIFLVKHDLSAGPFNLTSDLPTSKKNPEKRELIDWVGTENVILP